MSLWKPNLFASFIETAAKKIPKSKQTAAIEETKTEEPLADQ